MTPGRVLFLGLLVIAGVLFLLNPGEEKFKEYLRTEMAQVAGEAARAQGERVAGEFGGAAAGFLAERLGKRGADVAGDFFDREDYKLFSIYSADLNGRQPGGAWKFLGIANWFTPIERPETSDFTG